jgi:hypothetical protein
MPASAKKDSDRTTSPLFRSVYQESRTNQIKDLIYEEAGPQGRISPKWRIK